MTPVVFPGAAIMAALAVSSKPLHVMETLDPAGMTVPAPTLIDNVGDANDDVELPVRSPHMLVARLLTTPVGKVIVMMFPLVREEDMLNLKAAVPPAPTAVDIIKPDTDVLTQLTHGLASRFTSKEVSVSNVFAASKLATL